jgi:hypothetical protein
MGSEPSSYGQAAAGELPSELVYAGFPSVSSRRRCWPRPGPVRRERCCSKPVSRSPSSAAHGPEVPVQIHGMDADELFAGEGDLQASRALVSRPRTPRCSSTPATGTCSLITVCRPTRSTLPRCLPNACSASSMASSSSGPRPSEVVQPGPMSSGPPGRHGTVVNCNPALSAWQLSRPRGCVEPGPVVGCGRTGDRPAQGRHFRRRVSLPRGPVRGAQLRPHPQP